MTHTQRRFSLALFLFAFLAFGAMPAQAQTMIYVDQDATGANNGTSWSNAYTALQDAFDEANQKSGTDYEIWIAEGTYYPDNDNVDNDGDGSTEHTAGADTSFTLTRDDVEIYGGFQSGDSFGDRDPDANVVTLSGDVDGDDDPFAPNTDSDVDDSTPTQTDHIKGNNSLHVLLFDGGDRRGKNVGANITTATMLNGVTVTGGNADGPDPQVAGGGLYCDGVGSGNECSPKITNVTFTGNSADFGAIMNDGERGTASPQITNATFTGNSAGKDGGAIVNFGRSGTSSPQITNAVFAGNTADRRGGAIYNFGRDGTGSPQITNAVFTGNSAELGGAIYNNGDSGTSSPQITNVTFAGNSADVSGGAIYNNGFTGTSKPVLSNAILWGNRADADADGTGSGDEVFNEDALPSIDYSIVEGGDAGIANGSGFSDGTGNLDKNPQFAGENGGVGPDGTFGTSDDDLRLQGPGSDGGASPAIDAGDNTAISESQDLGGNTRKQDVGSVSDTGNGTSPIVDMGAYESDGSTLPVELASFDAQATGGAVALNWQTASETGNAGFVVQRRAAGDTWTKIDFVDSKAEGGTTTQPQSYRFTDADLPYDADRLTYRLKQVDTDGTTSFSDKVSVERGAVTELQLLGTYPNPARTTATVRFAVPEVASGQSVTMRLYDVMGRQVRTVTTGTEAGRHETQLSTDDLSSGVYFLRLQADGTVKTQRLTVVR